VEFMSVREASGMWNCSERWVQKLCEEGRIAGVLRFGRSWMIPKSAKKPSDLRCQKKKDGDPNV
jgi:excisionase family DNA binding protein